MNSYSKPLNAIWTGGINVEVGSRSSEKSQAFENSGKHRHLRPKKGCQKMCIYIIEGIEIEAEPLA